MVQSERNGVLLRMARRCKPPSPQPSSSNHSPTVSYATDLIPISSTTGYRRRMDLLPRTRRKAQRQPTITSSPAHQQRPNHQGLHPKKPKRTNCRPSVRHETVQEAAYTFLFTFQIQVQISCGAAPDATVVVDHSWNRHRHFGQGIREAIQHDIRENLSRSDEVWVLVCITGIMERVCGLSPKINTGFVLRADEEYRTWLTGYTVLAIIRLLSYHVIPLINTIVLYDIYNAVQYCTNL